MGGGMGGAHIPVLARPAMEWLRIRPGGVYVDCTAGAGGHSELIARQLAGGRLIALDRDPEAVRFATARLQDFTCATVIHANYGRLAEVLAELGVAAADGVLIDAGVSSMQFDDAARGFSLQGDGPLDMRMDQTEGMTALEYLATVDPEELARVLRTYGDVGPARRLAHALSRRARERTLHTTADLVGAIHDALSFVRHMPEEVRTVFQAIRIAVNDELRWLEMGLEQAIDVLAPEGRLVAISFHSGEDRIVKNVLNRAGRPQREFHPDGRVKSIKAPLLRVLTRKPVLPNAAELRENPRAHSAKLRAAERVAGEGVP